MEYRSLPQGFHCAGNPGGSPSEQLCSYEQSLFAFCGLSTAKNLAPRMKDFRSILLSLVPSDLESTSHWLSVGLAARQEIFGTSIHNLLIFSIENNFAGLNDVPIHGISKFLKQDTKMYSQLSRYRQASGKNIFKALVENLIRAAIEDCDAYLVTQYLKTGLVNPNDIVCKFKGWRYTALERAAMLRSFDVTKALLDTGANVNKTYSPALQGPLHFSISKTQEGTSVDVQLVNILLENGASFPVELARKALQSCNPGLIRFLMTKLSLLDHCDCWGLLTCVKDLANSELAAMVIMQIVQVCSQSGFPRGTTQYNQLAHALHSQMSSAARSGSSIRTPRY